MNMDDDDKNVFLMLMLCICITVDMIVAVVLNQPSYKTNAYVTYPSGKTVIYKNIKFHHNYTIKKYNGAEVTLPSTSKIFYKKYIVQRGLANILNDNAKKMAGDDK